MSDGFKIGVSIPWGRRKWIFHMAGMIVFFKAGNEGIPFADTDTYFFCNACRSIGRAWKRRACFLLQAYGGVVGYE